jgi:2-dehydropantoate 2-reductase
MSGLAAGRIVLLGGGAVGSFVGAGLAAAGHEVVLIDGWPEHLRAIRAEGVLVETPEGMSRAKLEAWDLNDAYRLRRLPVAAAFLCVKLYDTDWAAALLAQWLDPAAPVVTLQNALVEERVARAVGWGRTLGAIGGGLNVLLPAPGVVRRAGQRGAAGGKVFKVGELHGRVTKRAEAIAALLGSIDSAAVTTDLWTERWTKLTANTMTTGLSGLSGLSLKAVYDEAPTQAQATRLAAEALAVGAALGFRVPALFGLAPAVWQRAALGDVAAVAEAQAALSRQAASMAPDGMSGTLQDLSKGRPSEVDFFNGFIASEAARLGVAAPTHARLAGLIRAVERGELGIAPATLARLDAR